MKLDIGKGTTQLIAAKQENGKVIIQMNSLFMPERLGLHFMDNRNFTTDGCTLVIHNMEGLEQLEVIVSKARKFLEEVES